MLLPRSIKAVNPHGGDLLKLILKTAPLSPLLIFLNSCSTPPNLPKPTPQEPAVKAFVATYDVNQGPKSPLYYNSSGGKFSQLVCTSDGQGRVRIDEYPKHDKFYLYDFRRKQSYLCNQRTQIYAVFNQMIDCCGSSLVDERSYAKESFLGTEKITGYDCRHYKGKSSGYVWYQDGEMEHWYCSDLNCCVRSTEKRVNNKWCNISLVRYSTDKPASTLFDLSHYHQVPIDVLWRSDYMKDEYKKYIR